MAPPPPPPPPPLPTGGTIHAKSGSVGDGYYSSNVESSSSNAARQRLGLTKERNTAAGTTRTTAAPGGMTSSSSEDWFASPGAAPAMATSSLSEIPTAPAPANSGFYSINRTAGAGSKDNMHSNYRNNPYGSNPYGSNPYGSSGSVVASGSGYVGGGYYGGSSSGYASQTNSNAMTGAIGGGGASAESNPNIGSTLNGIDSGNSFEMIGALGGPIGGPSTISATVAPTLNVFDPNVAAAKKAEAYSGIDNALLPAYEEDYYNEPPLLEELGVNFPHIYSKSRAVLFPFGKHAKSLESVLIENDADLAGPLAFALGLGGELLLSGKLHFGYVYGFGVSGCFFMTFLLNLLNPNGAVSMWTVVSILGYALLPVNLLAGINILMRVHKLGIWGMVMAVLTIAWCTTASARLFERGCNMREQRFLVAYPTALLYSAFVIITIF